MFMRAFSLVILIFLVSLSSAQEHSFALTVSCSQCPECPNNSSCTYANGGPIFNVKSTNQCFQSCSTYPMTYTVAQCHDCPQPDCCITPIGSSVPICMSKTNFDLTLVCRLQKKNIGIIVASVIGAIGIIVLIVIGVRCWRNRRLTKVEGDLMVKNQDQVATKGEEMVVASEEVQSQIISMESRK